MTKNIDPTFTPSLKKLGSDYNQFFRRWQIDHVGQPALAREGTRAAVWIPRIFNAHGEAPVLLASAEYGVDFTVYSAQWFGGVVLRENVINTNGELEIYAEAAEFSAPNIGLAIGLVSSLIVEAP